MMQQCAGIAVWKAFYVSGVPWNAANQSTVALFCEVSLEQFVNCFAVPLQHDGC